MHDIRTKSTDRLVSVITKINDVEELYAFLEDLCTVKELQDMAQRFDTAILLKEKNSYQKIISEVNVSTATISRVNRCLEYGAGGYDIALAKLKEIEAKK
ncbi:MAG: hypothetical protein J6Z00_02450 [Clostridia bacterium]|nr:hypothetical protein [Clostridia bacterium]